MRANSMMLEVMGLVILSGLGISTTVYTNYKMMQPMSVTLEDKTAKAVEVTMDEVKDKLYGVDLLLSLVLTDENAPYPRRIKIGDSPIYDLDNMWLSKQQENVSYLYNNYIKENRDKLLASEFIPEDKPYIHYTFREE